MLARLLRVALLLEVGLVTVVLHYAGDVDGPVALLLALLLAMVWPAAVMLIGFAVAWARRMQRPPSMQIGPVWTARMVAQEILITVLLYRVMQPLGHLAMGDPTRAGNGGPEHVPVLLVHGFLCNSVYWWLLRRQLADSGITDIYAIDLEPLLGSIDGYAERIAKRIDEIRARSGAPRVLLVGHSMGGLAIRAYLRDYEVDDRVAGVLTLGTPHHGTVHATLMFGENAYQMRPASHWLSALNASEATPASVPLMSLYSCHDNIVAPQDSAQLGYATNTVIRGVGHLALAWDAATVERIVAEIRSRVYPRATDTE